MTVIAMTQEMGTLGKDVAAGVAQKLSLKLVRHELGDDVAQRLRVEKSLIRRLREGQAGWFERRASTRRASRSTPPSRCSTWRSKVTCSFAAGVQRAFCIR